MTIKNRREEIDTSKTSDCRMFPSSSDPKYMELWVDGELKLSWRNEPDVLQHRGLINSIVSQTFALGEEIGRDKAFEEIKRGFRIKD